MRSVLALITSLFLSQGWAVGNDPLKNLQWGVLNSGQSVNEALTDVEYEKVQGVLGVDVGRVKTAALNWNDSKREVLVAVIDSGVDVNHPDLKDRIFLNSADCDSLGRPPFRSELDKDGNGYAGDCMGWNVSGNGDENRVNDDIGHGTHVSGIIAAIENNGVGISGVAPKVKILPIKLTFRGDQGAGYTTRMLKALQYALDMKADVINLSLGWPAAADTASLQKKIKEALERGVIIVVAAGNNTTEKPIYPCSYEGVVCVGSIRPDSQLSMFSNFGSHVDLLAPGSNILSLIPTQMSPSQFSVTGYDFKSGTSQATPFVSAAFAVLKSVLPEATTDELKARLFISSRPRPTVVSAINGLIQIDKSLEVAPQSAVFPVLKGEQMISVSDNGAFELQFAVKNYWKASGAIALDLEVSKNVTLTATQFTLPSLAEGQTEVIKIAGQINGSAQNHVVTVKLKVTEGAKVSNYSFSKTLVKTVTPVTSNLAGLDFDLSGIKMDRELTKLRPQTVKNSFKKTDESEYFFISSQGEKYFLTLMRASDNRLLPTTLDLDRGETVLNLIKMDLNGDGKADYLMQSYNTLKGDNSFKLWYLNSNLKPLFNTPFFTYDATLAMPNWREMAWVGMNYQGQRMLVPLYIFKGQVVPADRNKDPFEDSNDQAVTNRIYFYRPNAQTKSFELRSFDTFKTMKQLGSSAGVKYPERMLIKLMFPPSLTEIAQGEARVLVEVVGGNSGARYYQLRIGDNAATKKLARISGQFNLQGFQMVRQPGLDSSSDSFFMSRTQSSSIIEFAWIQGLNTPKFYSYVHPKKGDNIIGALTASGENGGVRLLVETKTQVNSLLIDSSGKKTLTTSPINRSSVLSSSVFTDLFAPIRIKGQIGLYIDSSQLYRGHAYTLSSTAGSFVPAIGNSLQIGDSCTALNPMVQGGESSFVVYCENLGTQRKTIYKIPML
ncbi:hypothetical protein AZI86_15980 [Bdellovibrio bacteriovorus]|uniref:Peptidase S8/S53 domain-containing protein n=1 Tax=Bdellovibrio bacteriovorus TaxID=959 RepID=A0A150WHL4_BDEBC|nr:S8 family peptidase [Bdellovibrio bacteriovorus]KYG63201.1 hypothetical protein AZI86_15980 [Bdellovibrio bacteriovorus]